MENKVELTDKQFLVIGYSLAASSIESACKEAGISRGTFYEWLKNKDFKDELKRQRDEIVFASINRLQVGMTKAVDVLFDLMDSDKPSIRLWAAKEMLHQAIRVKEDEDIIQRLESLEQEAGKKNEN
ncbi:MAG: phBC6A51 family helix-turn-helix protein [Candidatus Omnitrophica bacterium]|nr:phBC6A51 family helix-turn-helix protein [Candidatus Omnitrophota bacterium]